MSIYECILSQVQQLILPEQHGFFNRRSTISNLASFAQFTGGALDKRNQVDVVYTDFSKTFDQVHHYILFNELAAMGFSRSLLLFLKSYVQNRMQYINIKL